MPEPSEGIVLDHSAWSLASEADDPWSDRLESLSGSCAELAWRVEGTGDAALLEVETSECSGAAVSHPIQGVLKKGDTVTFILWHLPLVKPEVLQGTAWDRTGRDSRLVDGGRPTCRSYRLPIRVHRSGGCTSARDTHHPRG